MKFISKNKSRVTVCALAVFALLLPKWQLAGISVRTWLVYLYTLIIGLLWILYGKKPVASRTGAPVDGERKWLLRKWNLLDSLLVVFLIGNGFQLVRDSLRDEGIDEKNLLMLALGMLFFLLSGDKTAAGTQADVQADVPAEVPVVHKYTDVFLGCGFVVYMGLLLHFLLNRAFIVPLTLLLENEQALLSFLLLMVTLAAEGYYREPDKGKQCFYGLLALTGYFLLFLQKNVVGILLGGMGFLVSALVHSPIRELIKRISQMAFAYFFLLSNMPLLQQFLPALREEGGYDMEGGIYLEMVLAAACVVFFSWWEKQPEEERFLPRYKKWVRRIAAGVGIVLLFLLVSGSRLEGMEGKGIAAFYEIAVKMRAYCAAHDNTFAAMLRQYGLSGAVWLLAVLFAACKRVWERRKRKKLLPAFAVLFFMYLLQSFFLAGQAVTAPVYVIFMVEILHGESGFAQYKKRKTGEDRSEKSEEEKGLEKKIKIWGILFLIAFATCFLATGIEALAAGMSEGGAAQEEPVTGVKIDSATLMYAVEKVNVRSGPGTDTEIMGELAQGEMVFAVELLDEGWYRIVFGGESGYVRQDFLALYGTAGAWEAPEQPAEPAVAGQDSAAAGKKTVKGNAADDNTEAGKTPASAKAAKAKKGNISTIIIITAAVLLILGYSVVQIVKEKRENEKENDEGGEYIPEPEAEAWDFEAEAGEWEDGKASYGEEAADEAGSAAADFDEWEDAEAFAAEDTVAAGYAQDAGKAENLAEDELVILDIDEI